MQTIYSEIAHTKSKGKKMLAVLLDPDKCRGQILSKTIAALKYASPDYIFVGGSHGIISVDSFIEILKDELNTKIILFPGCTLQLSSEADALLYITLISGRNPELLIGQHVTSAIMIKQSGIETIPTGYILIEGGKTSSVQYISNTMPIPNDKKEIALSTAIAGELLGLKMIYLEAGSGAEVPVSSDMISLISSKLKLPLIVGGGIKTTQQLKNAYNAGADLVVVGNIFETTPEMISEFINYTKNYNK